MAGHPVLLVLAWERVEAMAGHPVLLVLGLGRVAGSGLGSGWVVNSLD
jgi:hypothetical protein